ncbi:baseplate J/gp47 family protein [uncultured Sphingomonas sp.]|uniref:baseplate J/gp47 family protein n=1 Tax=uncultured Sphingomonas sp. TaxID=158754 RepID=UPI0025974AEA|nr:baseplate J/gp47 family protein [uncultured Sphingomonas sp.]
MTFARPTLDDLRKQSQADLQSALPGADALLRYSNLSILANILAGLATGHYGYLDYIARQATPFTAIGEMLEGWAGLKGVTRKPATAATGAVTFTGTVGTTIPTGTSVLRGDGYAYATSVDATVGVGGTVLAPISAVTAGTAGNAIDGSAFALTSGVSGIAAAGTATGPVTGGAEVESDDSLRSRMLLAYASPPQGGSASDYRQWALAVPGVTRAWVAPGGMGPSTVVLYFMMDDAQASHGGYPQGTNGVAAAEARDIAATGDQLTVANAIFLRQPVTPIIYAVSPRANQLGFTIAGLVGASATLKGAIASAITRALLASAVPGGVTNMSTVEAAIAAVNGSAGFVITSVTASAGTVTPGAAGNIVSNAGCLPALGGISWA